MNGHVGEGETGPVARYSDQPAMNSHVGKSEARPVVRSRDLPAMNGHIAKARPNLSLDHVTYQP
jgi:hypothetical protein